MEPFLAPAKEKEHIIGTFMHKEQRAVVLLVLFRALTEPCATLIDWQAVVHQLYMLAGVLVKTGR